MDIQLNLHADTHKKIMYILSQYSNTDDFFKNIINYQISLLQKEIINVKIDLDDFEKNSGMSSEKFYSNYKNSKVDDSEDTLLWVGLYELLLENEKKIAKLQ